MIALVRVDFPNTPAGASWSDAMARDFMDPAIPFSMAHYWMQATFGQVDVRSIIFAPITIDRPQPPPPRTMWNTNDEFRSAITSAVVSELDRVANPDWESIDHIVIVFGSSGTDLSGGPGVLTPGFTAQPVARFNSDSRFDIAAQEIGHAFGLNHEFDAAGSEYGCPYSVMSAATSVISFVPPFDPRLPGTANPIDQTRLRGPLIPAAHLYINERRTVNPIAALNHVDSVTYVSVDYADYDQRVELVARDAALAAWPARRTVLAVVPPVLPAGDTYFLELRRPDSFYEQGISSACVVVLAGNFFEGSTAVSDPAQVRLKYMGTIDVTAGGDDIGFRSPEGGFVARPIAVAAGHEAVTLLIRSGNGPASYAVRLGEGTETRTAVTTSGWQTAEIAPCRNTPKRRYGYRTTAFTSTQIFLAKSLGYVGPTYQWTINDVGLAAQSGSVVVDARCRRFDAGVFTESRSPVQCSYIRFGNRLELTVPDAYDWVDLTVRVTVEGPAGGAAPTRSDQVTASCSTLDIEWDEAFQRDRADCIAAGAQEETGVGIIRSPGGIDAAGIRASTLELLGIGVPGPDALFSAHLDVATGSFPISDPS